MNTQIKQTDLDWTPIAKRGTNLKSHNLNEVSSTRLEYKQGLRNALFMSIWLGTGLLAMVFALASQSLIWAAFGLVFVAIGGSLFYKYRKPIVFDKQKGFFWKSFKQPNQRGSNEHHIRLDEIVGGANFGRESPHQKIFRYRWWR